MMSVRNAKNIIALEGAAFAGKTTLLEYLKKHFDREIKVIPEGGEFIGGDVNGPSLPFLTIDDARASTHFCLAVERKRCEAAMQFDTRFPVIMDRSTPISSLIFYKLVKERAPNLVEIDEDFYQHALDVFYKAILEKKIFIPKRVVYLRPENREVFLSRLDRGVHNSVFESLDSFLLLDNLYKRLIEFHYPDTLALELYSNNTEENLRENATKIVEFAKMSPTHEVERVEILKNFLHEGREVSNDFNLKKEEVRFRKAYEKASNAIIRAQK